MHCWGELKAKELMRAIFRICVNESQPGLQLVEMLATPLAASLLTAVNANMSFEKRLNH